MTKVCIINYGIEPKDDADPEYRLEEMAKPRFRIVCSVESMPKYLEISREKLLKLAADDLKDEPNYRWMPMYITPQSTVDYLLVGDEPYKIGAVFARIVDIKD